MALTALDLPAPANLEAVHAGDVDGDGVADLIFVGTASAGTEPDRVTLHWHRLDSGGRLVQSGQLALGNRPAFWSTGRGLWVLDGDGLSRFDPVSGTLTRVYSGKTVLSGLGTATPVRAELTADLDGDKLPELLIPTPGKLVVQHADGRAMGSVPLRAEANLGSSDSFGGVALSLTSLPPAWVIADADGDKKLDILFPAKKSVAVYYTGDTVGARAATVPLPIDVEPEPENLKPGAESRRLSQVWLKDLSGDGKVDFLAHRFVTSGGIFGATAEVLWSIGTGTAFGPMVTIRTPSAALSVEPVDLDRDGDQEILTRDVDVGISNVARAVMSKAVRVQLTCFSMGQNVYPMTGFAIRSFNFPIDLPARFQEELSGDVDGDGRLDLVTNDALDVVRVYRGRPGGFDSAHAHEWSGKVPLTNGALRVEDLTGDGRAEIVVWGEDERVVRVLRI